MKEVKSETRRPKSQNASYQKRANSASSKRANASTKGGCTNRHVHRHSVQPSLQRSHDIAHRTLLIEPLRSRTDAGTQHKNNYGSHCCCMQQCGIKCSLHTGSKCSHTLLCRWNNLSTSGPRKKKGTVCRDWATLKWRSAARTRCHAAQG